LDVPTLKDKYKNGLGRNAVSQEIRNFAGTFPALQEGRHRADLDPGVDFSPSDVSDLIDAADFAMKAFDGAQADEKADVLALLLVGARD
jgi:hypothetical protein